MVITLVPGIFADQGGGADTYATVRGGGGWLGKYIGTPTDIPTSDVADGGGRMLQQQRLPEFVMPFMIQRIGQGMIQQAVVLQEANRLGLKVTEKTCGISSTRGCTGRCCFRMASSSGTRQYRATHRGPFPDLDAEFETEVKKEIEENRLRAMVTGGITVSDAGGARLLPESGDEDQVRLRGDQLRRSAEADQSERIPSCRPIQSRTRRNTRTRFRSRGRSSTSRLPMGRSRAANRR